MDKSPEAFRTISEVADALDVPPHVLRFWETRFTQVKPVKRGGGRRYYRPEDVRLLRGIRGLLYDDGMTIKGVQKILREKGIRHVIGLGTVLGSEGGSEAAPGSGAMVEAAPEAATAASAARKHAAERPARPQADLFPEPATEILTAATARVQPEVAVVPDEEPAAETAAAATVPAGRRKSLRALVAELEALRAVMIADPKR